MVLRGGRVGAVRSVPSSAWCFGLRPAWLAGGFPARIRKPDGKNGLFLSDIRSRISCQRRQTPPFGRQTVPPETTRNPETDITKK